MTDVTPTPNRYRKSFIAMMAPHHKQRDGGRLLIEADQHIDELADCLRELVEESIQADCSCKICNPAYHNALALLKRIGK